MPNARKKGKKFVGAWVPQKLYAELQRIARDRECAASEIIDELLTEHVSSHDALQDAPCIEPTHTSAASSTAAAPTPPASYKKSTRKNPSRP